MGQRFVRVLAIGAVVAAVSAPGAGATAVTGARSGVPARPATRSAWAAAVAAAPRVATVATPTPVIHAAIVGSPAVVVDPAVDLVSGQTVHVTATDLGTGQIVL